MLQMQVVLQTPEEFIKSPGALHVGAGNQTGVLPLSRKCSDLLSHSAAPILPVLSQDEVEQTYSRSFICYCSLDPETDVWACWFCLSTDVLVSGRLWLWIWRSERREQQTSLQFASMSSTDPVCKTVASYRNSALRCPVHATQPPEKDTSVLRIVVISPLFSPFLYSCIYFEARSCCVNVELTK